MAQVYKITNTKNGKAYIGVCKRTVEFRWKQHCYHARRLSSSLLHRAIAKYGPEVFEKTVLLEAEWNEVLAVESRLIIDHGTATPNGYNIHPGGLAGKPGTSDTKKWSPEQRRNHSELLKGNQHLVGHQHTDETKMLISIKGKGRKLSKETCQRISQATTGENNPMFGKPSPRRGVKLSDETKRKLSEAQRAAHARKML